MKSIIGILCSISLSLSLQAQFLINPYRFAGGGGGGGGSSPTTTDLMVWWALDESSGNFADSHSTTPFTLTAVGSPTYSVGSAVQGTAITFNGTSGGGYSVGADPEFSGIAICAWIKTTTTAGGCIVCVVTEASSDKYTEINIHTTGVVRAASRNTVQYTSDSTGTANDGNWHFVVGNFASSTSRTVYLDGVAATENTTASTYATHTAVSVGYRKRATPDGWFNGTIDEVAIFDRVLTADEITWLYNGGAGRPYSSL